MFDDLLLFSDDFGERSRHAYGRRMANRRRYSRGTNQFVADETDELSRLSLQHFHERTPCLHIRHATADCADLSLFPGLPRATQSRADLRLCLHLAGDGGAYAIFHHLQPGHDGVLDPRNFDHRFYRLFIRVFSRRPNVSDRHHAKRGPGGNEVVAVLLRAVLSDRHFPWATSGRPTCGGISNSVRLALAHLGRRACDVETRPRPLSSCRRLENLFFKFALILFRDRAPLMLRKIPRDDCLLRWMPTSFILFDRAIATEHPRRHF